MTPKKTPAKSAAKSAAKKRSATTSRKLEQAIVSALEDIKARDIEIFDVRHLTSMFDQVIIVTARVVRDRQLQDTVASFDHTPGMIVKIDEDSAQLRQALEGKQARIIITTLQKFPVVAQAATNLSGSRFAVIADEAHSSQSGEAAKDLKAVLSGKTGEDALLAAEAAEGAADGSGMVDF